MCAVGQSRLARRRGAENILPPMRCGTGKGQVAGCGVAPTDGTDGTRVAAITNLQL
jgi:hypothetical protein